MFAPAPDITPLTAGHPTFLIQPYVAATASLVLPPILLTKSHAAPAPDFKPLRKPSMSAKPAGFRSCRSNETGPLWSLIHVPIVPTQVVTAFHFSVSPSQKPCRTSRPFCFNQARLFPIQESAEALRPPIHVATAVHFSLIPDTKPLKASRPFCFSHDRASPIQASVDFLRSPSHRPTSDHFADIPDIA